MSSWPGRKPYSIVNDQPFFYVLLEYSVWPQIYGNPKPILFPTEHAALRFAKGNVSTLIPKASVFSPWHDPIKTFTNSQTIPSP